MAKMYQNDLSQVLVEKHGYTKRKAQAFVSSIVNVIQDGLERDQMVKIKGLGTFKIVDVSARESVNVNTGERLVIQGHSKLSFLPDNAMKELVNRPFSQFETVILNDGVVFNDIEEAVDEESVAPIVEEEPSIAVDEEEPVTLLMEEKPEPVEEEEIEPVVEEEPVPAPVIEEEPTPIVEEEPAPVIEEEPAPIVEEEPAPVIEEEPEPVVAEEPVSAPVVEEEPTTVVVEEPAPVVEEEVHRFASSEVEKPNSSFSLKWLLALLLSLAVGFVVGYLVGKSSQQTTTVPMAPEATAAPLAPTEENTTDSLIVTETVATPSPSEAAVEATPENTQPEWERYNQMHPRTRDGYYYIMGFDRIEVARQGDNARRIASRILGGADMSCYIEVYNGIDATTELEAGTEVKIPKLEPKKTVRRRLQQQNKQ